MSLKVGDKLICKPKNMPETSHCIRGTVLAVDEVSGNVTISRALKFGELPLQYNLTLKEETMLEFYTVVADYDDKKVKGEII